MDLTWGFGMNLNKYSKVLMIGAHPDDCEIYAGGLARLLVEQGSSVTFWIMADGRYGDREDISPENLVSIRRKEQEDAAKILGVGFSFFRFNDYHIHDSDPVRFKMVGRIRQEKPDLIVTHRVFSGHPDHIATGQIVQNSMAMLNKGNYGNVHTPPPCEVPPLIHFWDGMRPDFRAPLFFDIGEVMKIKQDAINAHKSQRGRYSSKYPRIQATQWAKKYQTGHQYSEVFEINSCGGDVYDLS